jgi:hypothetical protein
MERSLPAELASGLGSLFLAGQPGVSSSEPPIHLR